MNVLLPQAIESEAIDLLERENCTIITTPDPKPETVLPLLKDAHGLILRTGITMTRDLIEAAEHLMVISRTGGGLDNVDVSAASKQGIIVTSNLGVNTISVAEHVLSMMLTLYKRLSTMDHAVRHSNFGIRYQNLPRDINGKTIGLMGFGRIGCELGKICRQALNMPVIAYDPYLVDEKKNDCQNNLSFCAFRITCMFFTKTYSIDLRTRLLGTYNPDNLCFGRRYDISLKEGMYYPATLI